MTLEDLLKQDGEWDAALHCTACHAWRCDSPTCLRYATWKANIESICAFGRSRYGVYIVLARFVDGRYGLIRSKPGEWEWGPGQTDYATDHTHFLKRLSDESESATFADLDSFFGSLDGE